MTQHNGLSFGDPPGIRTLQSVPGGHTGAGPPSPAKAGSVSAARQAIVTENLRRVFIKFFSFRSNWG